MKLAALTILGAIGLNSLYAYAACSPVHSLKLTVDITSCKSVTFHERQFRQETVNVHDIEGTLMGIQTRSIELVPHVYDKAIDPTWLRERFPIDFEVSVFLPQKAEIVCQALWEGRKNRVVVPIQTCCDTLPHEGICALPRVYVPVKLEPIEQSRSSPKGKPE